MNWKERFDIQFTGWELAKENEISPSEVKRFISTEIIEKLIADIPDDLNRPCQEIPSGDYMKQLKQQLISKWL